MVFRPVRQSVAKYRFIVFRVLGTFGLLSLLALSAYGLVRWHARTNRPEAILDRIKALSLKTSLLAHQLVGTVGDFERDSLRDELLGTANRIAQFHERIVKPDSKRAGTSDLPPAIHRLYFERPTHLDRQIGKYVAEARSLAHDPDSELTPTNRHLAYLRSATSEKKLLGLLDTAAQEYRRSAEVRPDQAWQWERWLFMALVLLLWLTAFIHFIPILRRVIQVLLRLENADTYTRAIVETAPDAIITLNEHGFIEAFNPAAERMFQIPVHEALGQNIAAFVPALVQYEPNIPLFRAFGGGRASVSRMEREVTGHRRDGSTLILDLAMSEMQQGGRPLFLVIARDVTAQKLAEQALAESRHQYEALVNSINGIVWEADAHTHQFAFVSSQAERILGYPSRQWLSESTFWHDKLYIADRERVAGLWARALEQESDFELEYRMLGAGGQIRWMRDLVHVAIEKDRPVKLRGVLLDITRQKQTEETNKKLAAIVNSSEDAIIGMSSDGLIVTWNSGAERLYRYSTHQIRNRPFSALIAPERPHEAQVIFDKIQCGEAMDRYETVHVKNGGQHVDVSLAVSPLRDENGRIIGASAIARNISDQKELERQQRQARELTQATARAKFGLIGRVGQEMLKSQGSGRDPLKLMGKLIDWAKIETGSCKLDISEFDLRDVIKGVIRAVPKPVQANGLEIISQVDKHLPTPLRGDSGRLRDVLSHLLGAAAHAAQEGELMMEAALEKETTTQVDIRFTVIDTRMGIRPREVRPRPSLLPPDSFECLGSGGAALDLEISKQILERMGGRLSVETVPGFCPTFWFTLRFEKDGTRPERTPSPPDQVGTHN